MAVGLLSSLQQAVFVGCHIPAPPVPPGGFGGSSLIKSEAPGVLVMSQPRIAAAGTCAVRSVRSVGAEH